LNPPASKFPFAARRDSFRQSLSSMAIGVIITALALASTICPMPSGMGVGQGDKVAALSPNVSGCSKLFCSAATRRHSDAAESIA
jgi:hypothetical protein